MAEDKELFEMCSEGKIEELRKALAKLELFEMCFEGKIEELRIPHWSLTFGSVFL